MDASVLSFYQRAMDEGEHYLSGNGRNYVSYPGVSRRTGEPALVSISVTRMVYCLFHPDEPDLIQGVEQLHHKDFNKLNDHPSNILRLTRDEHSYIHRTTFLRAQWGDEDWVSPILVQQIKDYWMEGMRSGIYRKVKVLRKGLVNQVWKYYHDQWMQELRLSHERTDWKLAA